MSRRDPAFQRFDPEKLRATLSELGVDVAHPVASRALAGAPLSRIEAARLRKLILRALLPEPVDHRSGAYADAKRRVREILREAGRPVDFS